MFLVVMLVRAALFGCLVSTRCNVIARCCDWLSRLYALFCFVVTLVCAIVFRCNVSARCCARCDVSARCCVSLLR